MEVAFMKEENRLRMLRKQRHLTQVTVQIETGIEQSLISKYERGKRIPPTESLIILAKYYHTSMDYIMGLTDIEKQYPITADFYKLPDEEFMLCDHGKKNLFTEGTLQELCLGLHSICQGAEARHFNGQRWGVYLTASAETKSIRIKRRQKEPPESLRGCPMLMIGLRYHPSASLVASYPMLQLSHIFLRRMLRLLPLSVYCLWHTGQLTVVTSGILWLSE